MLNAAQIDAVKTLSGPLLVLAGAGTGKTSVVTHRIAELVRSGVRANRILAVTFTNKAAAEMQERAAKVLGKRLQEKPEISTFHSLCVRVLRRNAKVLGYPTQFAIYDRRDQESLARSVLRELKTPNDALRPGDLIGFISRWKCQSIRPEQAVGLARTDKEHIASAGYRRYQRSIKAAGAFDFDDLLLSVEELFEKFADVRRTEARRFEHILIDEYQDTNGSQYRIIRHLANGHRNLCVVGDDDQSIYGWRGAEVSHILRFKQDWPDAKVVRLEDNYRSTAEILTVANRLIKNNRSRHEKTLIPSRPNGKKPRIVQYQDEDDEAAQVIGDIRRLLSQPGVEPRDVAILFRTNEQPRPFEMALRRAELPYTLIGGQSFYDRKEVRDVLAYLKLLDKPSDEIALLRIINMPPRGIGQRAVETLLARAVSEGKPLWDILAAPGPVKLDANTQRAIGHFRAMIQNYSERAKGESLVEVASNLIATIGYQNELTKLYKDVNEQRARWGAVGEVINSLASYEKRAAKPSLGDFLDEVILRERDDAEDKDSQLERNAIALMTLHSAKGLEFPHVYLVGMEEGLLPHYRAVEAGDQSIDEERRLCYVGVTRAQDRLTMSLALSRLKWGKQKASTPSRFLFEIAGTPTPKAKRQPASGVKRTATPSLRGVKPVKRGR